MLCGTILWELPLPQRKILYISPWAFKILLWLSHSDINLIEKIQTVRLIIQSRKLQIFSNRSGQREKPLSWGRYCSSLCNTSSVGVSARPSRVELCAQTARVPWSGVWCVAVREPINPKLLLVHKESRQVTGMRAQSSGPTDPLDRAFSVLWA